MADAEGGPSRILMTADAVGGVWTYAADLVRALDAAGVATTLAVLGPPPDSARVRALADVASLEIISTGLPLDWLATREADLDRAARALARLAAHRGAEVVQLNHPALAAHWPAADRIVAVAHSCVATWWAANRSGPLPPDLAWRAALAGEGYRRARAVVAPTAAFAQATATAHRLRRPPLVVRNGRAAPARAPRDIVARRPFALTAGRLWDEGKNVAALDRAAVRLAVPVLAAGPTEGPNGARVALRSLRPLGTLGADELDLWMHAAAVFVSTARYEPFGLAVLEAAQRGCALVLSDIATFRELWEGAALFVPADDEVAIAQAIAGLVGRPDRLAEMARAARRAARRYSARTMAEGMRALFAGLAGPARRDGERRA